MKLKILDIVIFAATTAGLSVPVLAADLSDIRRLFATNECEFCDLRGANLRGADLRGADLSGSSLRDADLRGANLADADLREVDFYGTDLRGANLSGAYIQGARNTRYAIR